LPQKVQSVHCVHHVRDGDEGGYSLIAVEGGDLERLFKEVKILFPEWTNGEVSFQDVKHELESSKSSCAVQLNLSKETEEGRVLKRAVRFVVIRQSVPTYRRHAEPYEEIVVRDLVAAALVCPRQDESEYDASHKRAFFESFKVTVSYY
jgi:hypothetical protein